MSCQWNWVHIWEYEEVVSGKDVKRRSWKKTYSWSENTIFVLTVYVDDTQIYIDLDN